MSSKVSGRKGSSSAVSSTPQPSGPVQATTAAKPPAESFPQDNLEQAAKELFSTKASNLMAGAFKIFGDNVVLPSHLTDPDNPQNDVRYLRLFAAVLGLDELEKYFFTLDDKKQREYLVRKAQQRKEKWAKQAKEKAEKRRNKLAEDKEQDT